MTEVAIQSFEHVGRELNVTLGEARTALENYVEQPDNVSLLNRTAAELHQVQGVLKVLEIYGAALLAEEMEQVAAYLVATAGEQKNQAESLDALMRSMVQLPSYLERVLAGGRDLALILLPLLNDLRAVRGSSLLSEGTLLLLNLKSDRQAQPAALVAGEAPLTIEQWGRRLRPRFQLGLVGWIRGTRPEQNLAMLAEVAHKLEQVASRQPVFQLWWVIGAVIEALQEHGLSGGVSIKRLLGLADREIKRLYEQTEVRYAQSPAVDLLNNLLYYVGRAESAGPRVTAVRASFRLNELLPVDDAVDQERESLSAPSVKLMQTVAAAIREDLGKVKDVLDIFVRRGSGQPQGLAPQVQMLHKIGDTLGVLGLGELRASVQGETERLEKIVAGTLQPEHSLLVDIAATLIGVEDKLDGRLVGMILPRARLPESADSTDADFQQVQSAVLRECILNLARLKESIAQSVGGTLDTAGLDAWPELMRGLKAGLLMLGKSRAVELVENIHSRLSPLMQPGGAAALAGGRLDRLADAIVSLEYYMETLQAGRSDPWYMLDNAQACLEAFEAEPPVTVPTVPPLEHSSFAQTVQLAGGAAAIKARQAGTVQDVGATAPLLATEVPTAPGHADPELLKLFVEEAREELARIATYFPVWEQNPLELSALQNVRRSMHTLKGSGRMVGARDLGEFAWACENLLNRLLDNTLTRSPPIAATLHEAVTVLPQLVDALEHGTPIKFDAKALMARAHALAAAREGADGTLTVQQPLMPPVATQILQGGMPYLDGAPPVEDATGPEFMAVPELAAEETAAPAPEPEPLVALNEAAAPAPQDDVLRDIYMRETNAHVATVRDYLRREAQRPAPHLLTEAVYRACHTLSGSSTMAQARHGIRLAQPLDHWLRKSFESGVGLTSSDLTVLEDCMSAMESVASYLDESTGYFVAHGRLLERLADAEKELDRRVTDSVEVERRNARSQPIGTAAEVAAGSQAASDAAAETMVASPLTAQELAAPEADHDPEHLASALDNVAEEQPTSHELTQLPQALDVELPSAEIIRETESIAPPEAEGPATDAQIDLPPEVPAQEEPVADFDPDVASIFTEEATELLEVCETQLAAWRTDPGNTERAAALKRPLHTLKGGARMAGITAMGDLSHELESLVNFIDFGGVPPSPADFDVLQASVDELARMRDSVAAGRGVAQARDLLERIRASLNPGQDAAAETPQVPQTPPEVPAVPETPQVPQTPPEVPDTPKTPEVPQSPELPQAPAVPTTSFQMLTESAFDGSITTTPQDVPGPGSAALPMMTESAPEPAAALPVPPGREPVAHSDRPEMARVDADLLDQLLNVSGEVSISRARLEQQMGSIEFNLGELSRTVTRLKEQQRKLEIETEKQILHGHEEETGHRAEFDPLELDRYSAIQQFSRGLAETASDVASIQQLLESLVQETQNLLQQQARTVTELQNGLMRTRMVPFQRHVQRLSRIVRQAAADSGKRAELIVSGASGELDRQVLERMLPPFEHMLRNAVVHGIETPEERVAHGKSESGTIHLDLQREGAEVMVKVSDDGAGMKLNAIRDKGLALGLIQPGQSLSDEDAMQLILEPGFSTAGAVTQQAGRGVGMDVVATEIKRLGGSLNMETHSGQGTTFTVRLPFTLAISHALVVRTGDEYYALPLPTVEGVLRLSKADVSAHLGRESATFEQGGQKYRFQHLAAFVGLEPSALPEGDVTVPVVLVRAGEHSTGLVADELIGSREIVVKSVGPQVSSIRGISGATILGDGRIVIILDIGALVRSEWRSRFSSQPLREKGDRRTFAMVVDDSITVRRVTQRLLERNGMRVLTARDGMDAITLLQDNVPDIILLDIEMPRMDGYEVAAHVRNDPRLRDVPIIMITSRVGEKHRARAIELGVDDYLGKPYQEAQLLDAIAPLVERHRETQRNRKVSADG
ncbi:MAG TPA: Hpt domain-containing protein [Steroidobacteraceae bacterium]|jgi:chemosensory pili system protein ChpA (sensor histidine kinase/response regulator)